MIPSSLLLYLWTRIKLIGTLNMKIRLIAVPALLIVATAPILYLSGLANFGFGLSS